MVAALVSLNAGVATVYSSGDLSSIVGVSAINSIVVTKNSQTPDGDPVIVDLSSGLAGISALSSISVQNGATATVGGGVISTGVATSLSVNGGILDIQGNVIGAKVLNSITVGPAGGEVKIEPTGLSAGVLTLPIVFVDSNGNSTTTIPSNFVMDFPKSTSIPASYDPLTNTTTIGDGISLLGVLGVGRTITLSGDPFNLKNTGTPQYSILDPLHYGSPTSYSKTFTQSDGNGGIITCFLSGSLINTTSGNTPVEDISIGDEIIAYVDGVATSRRVTWAGQAHCNVRAHLPDDEAGYPVRILKDAISDGVPFKDLLITAEHCLFFDGQFVPARMLVNGRSIFFDKSITSYDYYHIETEDHSVIMADGMLTESYLDTGNRRTFSQKGNVVSIGGSRNLSWNDAAAPLTVSRETVEPLFRKIERRADKAGFAIQAKTRPLTNDSDLHLTTDTGAVIRPARQNNGRVMFMIPAGVENIRIVSNASRPCDVIGPFVDDRRQMGVLVGTVTLFESNRTRTLTDHLHDAQLSGWNNVEEGTMRWTSGNALLPLGERAPGTLALMAIEVRTEGPYVLDETISERQALKA